MFEGRYSTELTAQKLVAALFALYKGEVDTELGTKQEFMPVRLIPTTGEPQTVVVKLDPERNLYDMLPDESAILRCITPEGKKVDFVSPPDAQRRAGFETALVYAEEGAVE